MRRRLLRAGALGCLLACLAASAPLRAQAPAQPEAATGFAPRPALHARHHMAVTANAHATDAAVAVLDAGGSAVDAAIAAQLVLNLVEPQSSGVGGGGFMLVYEQAAQRVWAYDGRERAPAAATAARFLGDDARPLAFHAAAVGGRSVGVPGLVAMLAQAHARHGRLAWARLFEPAIGLAEAGFRVSPRLHALLETDPYLRRDAAARAYFYRADGSAQPVGSVLRNPAFAGVLRQLAVGRGEALYRGELAVRVAQAAQAHAASPGDLSAADLAGYRSVERAPLCGAYRGYRVCGMPPPSSGGLTLLQMLAVLERRELAREPPNSPLALHWLSEAGRLAYADRARYLGDPDFVHVPVAELLDRGYLGRRAALMRDDASLGRAAPGQLAGATRRPAAEAQERASTTHLSIVDAHGNAVALTSSIEDAFGSRIMVEGFLLNNQLTDFAFAPVGEGALAANRVEAGKRPLSSMAPTLVFDRAGRLYAVLGSPGGSRIINYVAQTLVALIDWRLAPDAALALPHAGSRNGPTEIEAGAGAPALREALAARGHEVVVRDMTSGLHLIVRAGDAWLGAADPRREGKAGGR